MSTSTTVMPEYDLDFFTAPNAMIAAQGPRETPFVERPFTDASIEVMAETYRSDLEEGLRVVIGLPTTFFEKSRIDVWHHVGESQDDIAMRARRLLGWADDEGWMTSHTPLGPGHTRVRFERKHVSHGSMRQFVIITPTDVEYTPEDEGFFDF